MDSAGAADSQLHILEACQILFDMKGLKPLAAAEAIQARPVHAGLEESRGEAPCGRIPACRLRMRSSMPAQTALLKVRCISSVWTRIHQTSTALQDERGP